MNESKSLERAEGALKLSFGHQKNVQDESNQYQLKPPKTTTNKINEEDFEDLSLGLESYFLSP